MKAYLSLLKHTPFFMAMSDEEILSILQCMSAVVTPYPKGSYILRAGNSRLENMAECAVHSLRRSIRDCMHG